MGQPIQEPTSDREIEGQAFRSRQLFRRPAVPAVPAGGAFELKVFSDTEVLVGGDDALIMMIPADLDGTNLIEVAAGVSTVDTGDDIEVGVRNETQSQGMLDDPIVIDQGDFTSYTSTAPPVIDAGSSLVATGDMISINIIEPGTDAMGLMVVLVFG